MPNEDFGLRRSQTTWLSKKSPMAESGARLPSDPILVAAPDHPSAATWSATEKSVPQSGQVAWPKR